ncbi:hypothetical protein CBP31_11235 [Oceanisphaera profunda]|uniref:Pilus assembly protein n=1 Tax=Oceanisphaera profunda TaxID=1416627 RepID=A0A1Y0D7E0_9GAMM|nr:hypothetical protein [Oceanisphaera profunda]ART83117.1 hypothetical protein CBP31_11235 [Oceanisphaera profunda]
MRTLELDFHSRPQASLLGWSLLVVGILVVVVSLFYQWRLTTAIGVQQHELARAEQVLPGHNMANGTGTVALSVIQEAELKEIRRVSEQMNRPWEGLLTMLEKVSRENVSLLLLAPDAHKRQLRISAESRDLPSMLAFHRQLEQSDELSDVSLLSHEIVKSVAEQPIRFNLLATWEVNHEYP